MASKLPEEKYSQEISQIMFQICILDNKIQGKEPMLHSWNIFSMQWLGKSKYTIFSILLKILNLWNLINVLTKKIYENIYLSVSYDF